MQLANHATAIAPPPLQTSSGSGWISQKLRGLFLPEDVAVAKLDTTPENEFYYNEELKRWVRRVRALERVSVAWPVSPHHGDGVTGPRERSSGVQAPAPACHDACGAGASAWWWPRAQWACQHRRACERRRRRRRRRCGSTQLHLVSAQAWPPHCPVALCGHVQQVCSVVGPYECPARYVNARAAVHVRYLIPLTPSPSLRSEGTCEEEASAKIRRLHVRYACMFRSCVHCLTAPSVHP